eukprot:GFYU01000801.1.p1 GENE.GFYU01000801.1~~GFYU01000801.1.p1  ORF type:complete len:211 (-),score=26.79 GFYU01000801.1:269-901(-)
MSLASLASFSGDDSLKLYKVILIGNSYVGKSSLMRRFTDGVFSEEAYSPTIGVDFTVKQVEDLGQQVRLQIWDTAGQERYRTLTNSYYRGAQGIFVVYDVTSQESYDCVEHWLEEIFHFSNPNVNIVLIGNKNDLDEEKVVDVSVAEELAQRKQGRNPINVIETSARDGTNVNQAFAMLVRQMQKSHIPQEPMDSVSLEPEKKEKKLCFC